jgi:hypothetical protein
VEKHWDILAKELQYDRKDSLDWQHFNTKKLLSIFYVNVNLEMAARNKLCLPPCKGFVEEYAIEFHNLCSCITKFPISTGNKGKGSLGLKEDVRNKIMLDPEGDDWSLGGHQASHSLRSHH